MKVVDSTMTAAAVLREIRGNAQFWLDKIEAEGVHVYNEHKVDDRSVVPMLQTYVNDCNAALTELKEPHDAVPSYPLSAG